MGTMTIFFLQGGVILIQVEIWVDIEYCVLVSNMF